MADAHLPALNTFCWPELHSPDLATSRAFYTALLGWTSEGVPMAQGTYDLWKLGDRDAGGLCAQMASQKAQGVPPHWLSYVRVAAVDPAAVRAAELGGTVVAGPFDVPEVGRMAVVQDPTGAVFALWESRGHEGIRAYREPGALCWTELATKDPVKAEAFYTGLFGWVPKPSDGPFPYTEWLVDGQPFGAMLPMDESWGDIPSHWSVYFHVVDVDDRAAAAQGLGATLLVPPQDIPHVGRFSVVRDPLGAVFCLFAGEM